MTRSGSITVASWPTGQPSRLWGSTSRLRAPCPNRPSASPSGPGMGGPMNRGRDPQRPGLSYPERAAAGRDAGPSGDAGFRLAHGRRRAHMSRPLRLVQVAPYPILPASAGGKIRIVQLARALCKLGVEVTLVAPYHVTQRRALAEREPFRLYQVPYAPFLLSFFLVDAPFHTGCSSRFIPATARCCRSR